MPWPKPLKPVYYRYVYIYNYMYIYNNTYIYTYNCRDHAESWIMRLPLLRLFGLNTYWLWNQGFTEIIMYPYIMMAWRKIDTNSRSIDEIQLM